MASGRIGAVLRQIRRWAGAAGGEEFTDGHLLQCFAEQRDEAAFDALLRRHGPLVLGVCHRVLGDIHDAEDAFQATFLVLARRAGALDRRGTLAGWLYTVAYRIAVRAKADAARRRECERRAAKMTASEANDDLVWRELRPVLDEELSRIPEKYRLPILLCYLEGKTQEEAAKLLGWPKGTVSGRLARAREVLRGRLARRGLALSATAVSAGLTENARGVVPPLLRTTTLDAALRFAAGQATAGAAADLARATLRGMGFVKAKAIAALVLTLTVIAAGTGTLIDHMGAATPQEHAEVREEKQALRRVDVYGDPLPPGAIIRLGTVRLCQGEGVRTAVFSPDGKLLASSGHYGYYPEVIRLWDVASGKEVRHFPGVASYLAFSPDGSCLATSSEGGRLCLWDVSTGKQLWHWDASSEPPTAPNMPPSKLYGIAFSPDGKSVAAAVGDGTIRLREAVTGKERLRLKADATSVTFAPGGKVLACFHFMRKTVSLWDLATGEKLHTLTHPANVISIAFSSDGRRLAVHPQWNKTFLWDVAKGRELRQVDAAGVSYDLRFTPDDKMLTTGDWSFDLTAGKEARRFNGTRPGIALSPDCRRWARADFGTLRVWDVATEQEVVTLHRHHGPIAFVLPSANGETVRTVGSFDETIREWDVVTGKHLREIETPPWQKFLAASDNSKVLVTPKWDGKCVLVDTASGGMIWEGGDKMATAALTGDGKRLAVLTGEKEKTIHLWDTVADKKLCKLRGEVDGSSRLAFSPDGKTLAAAVSLDNIRLWDVATGQPRKGPIWKPKPRANPYDESIWPTSRDPVNNFGIPVDPNAKPSPAAGLLFSPSGATVAVMSGFHHERWSFYPSDAGLIRLYDVTTGKELFQLRQQEPVAVFSPDGKTLATGGHRDCAVYLWDAANGKQLARLEGHRGAITALSFSADGRTLISGSADSTALVWAVSRGK